MDGGVCLLGLRRVLNNLKLMFHLYNFMGGGVKSKIGSRKYMSRYDVALSLLDRASAKVDRRRQNVGL